MKRIKELEKVKSEMNEDFDREKEQESPEEVEI